MTAAEAAPATATATPSSMHFPSLLVALAIMLGGTVYPLVLAGSDGRVDHGFVTALFWAMSAGLVRGVGFVPRALGWKLLFSGWSCLAALLLAAWLRWFA
jgi:predicted membrane protein